MISIIIPHYNHTKTLRCCLDSIARQTWRDFEIIIVDDGSNTAEKESLKKIVANFSRFHGPNHGTKEFYGLDHEIKPSLIFAEHRGANAARNRGAREAKGKYLLFCDADIIMRPNILEKMVQTLEVHKEAAYAYSSFYFGWKLFKLHPFARAKLRQNNFIHTTSLLRREYFPGFDERIYRLQDWDLYLTILERGGQGIWIPEVLFKVIPHARGMSVWLPQFMYKIPWSKFGIHIKILESFNQAKKIILEKHKIYE